MPLNSTPDILNICNIFMYILKYSVSLIRYIYIALLQSNKRLDLNLHVLILICDRNIRINQF